MPFRLCRSKTEAALFFAVWLACLFFTDLTYNTNFDSRYYLAKALVERRSFCLTPDHDRVGPDQALYDGRYYSDKPPGSAVLMLPAFLLARLPLSLPGLPARGTEKYDRLHAWFTRALSSCLLAALAVVLFARLAARYLDEPAALFAALAGYLTTTAVAQDTHATGEVFTTALVLASFHQLLPETDRPGRPLLAGLAAAAAALVTYQAALIAVGGLLYLALGRDRRGALRYLAPLGAAAFLILLYNRLLFGGWWNFPVLFFTDTLGDSAFTTNFEWPSAGKLYQMLFSPYRGIFFYSPFLLLTLAGARDFCRRDRAAAAGLGGAFFAVFAFYLFNQGWYAGWDYGWRYILIVQPLFALPAWTWFAGRRRHGPEIILLAWGGALAAIGLLPSLFDIPSITDFQNPIFLLWLPNLLRFGPVSALTDFWWWATGAPLSPALAWSSSLLVLGGLWAFCLCLGFSARRERQAEPESKPD
ncbi:MAG: hypothetical protein GX444_04915 [Myxococcales bacterium]|nr:hypothetical protein [Myxococcales bacterium]